MNVVKKGFSFVAITLATLLLLACGSEEGKHTLEGTIIIGTVAPLSGDQAQIGEDMVRGVEVAISEINTAGGLLGHEVKLVKLDDRADPKEATSAASRLAANEKVIGVIGHLNSGSSIPASAVYHRHNIAMITPVSTADQLTEQGFKNVFRVVLRNSDQGPAAADYAKNKLKAKRVAVVHDKSAYGKGIAKAFADRAKALGMDIVAEEAFNVGDKDFSTLVTKLAGANPDVVYAGAMFTEGALLMRQARPRGLKATFLSGDGFFAPKLMELGGDAVEGTIVSFLAPPWNETSAAGNFLKAFEDRYGESVKTYAPLAFDATMVLAEAIRKAGKADRDAVVASLRDADFHWQGIAADYRFNTKGDLKKPEAVFYRVSGGQFRADTR